MASRLFQTGWRGSSGSVMGYAALLACSWLNEGKNTPTHTNTITNWDEKCCLVMALRGLWEVMDVERKGKSYALIDIFTVS